MYCLLSQHFNDKCLAMEISEDPKALRRGSFKSLPGQKTGRSYRGSSSKTAPLLFPPWQNQKLISSLEEFGSGREVRKKENT